jgi:hypothetical protein
MNPNMFVLKRLYTKLKVFSLNKLAALSTSLSNVLGPGVGVKTTDESTEPVVKFPSEGSQIKPLSGSDGPYIRLSEEDSVENLDQLSGSSPPTGLLEEGTSLAVKVKTALGGNSLGQDEPQGKEDQNNSHRGPGLGS